jgi:hypothetical protein
VPTWPLSSLAWARFSPWLSMADRCSYSPGGAPIHTGSACTIPYCISVSCDRRDYRLAYATQHPNGLTRAVQTVAPERPAAVDDDDCTPARITFDEARALWEGGGPVIVVDWQSKRTYGASDGQALASVRLPPDHVRERATELGPPKYVWGTMFST